MIWKEQPCNAEAETDQRRCNHEFGHDVKGVRTEGSLGRESRARNLFSDGLVFNE